LFGVELVCSGDLPSLLQSFLGGIASTKAKKGLLLVWHTVLCSIWLARNDRIFCNKYHSIDDVVEIIKKQSWV
jgi:hypothetical protein